MDVSNFPIGPLEDHLPPASPGSAKSTKPPSDDGSHSASLPPGLLIQHSAGSNSWEVDDEQGEDNTACSIFAVDSAINNLEVGLLRAEVVGPEDNNGPMMVHATAPPPPRCSSFRFSKKRFVATSEFYLQPHHGLPDTTTTTFPDLLGQIEKCPNEKTNENNYIVRWSHVHQSKAQVPANLIPHLCTRYPKNSFKDSFRELIESFENSGSTGILPSDPLVVTAAAANIILAAVATPPSMFNQTRAALSAIYTAGTSGGWSTMSSLGRSQRSLFNAEEEVLHECNDGDVEDNDNKNNEEEDNNSENGGDVEDNQEEKNSSEERGPNDHGLLPIPPVSTRTRKRKRARDSDDDVTEGKDNHELD